MRNIRKIGQLVNLMDDLKVSCADAHLAATKDPDYTQRVKPIESKLQILAEHLADFQIELIDLLTISED